MVKSLRWLLRPVVNVLFAALWLLAFAVLLPGLMRRRVPPHMWAGTVTAAILA